MHRSATPATSFAASFEAGYWRAYPTWRFS